jgi:hypothetical protein
MRIAIAISVLALGCGSVSAVHSDAGADSGSAAGAEGGGTHGGGGTSGAAGGGGLGGTVVTTGGGGGAGAAGGANGRALGAGCTDDSQCSSGICGKASASDTSGTCCTGRPTSCSSCVGGYLTPVEDGTAVLCATCESGQAVNLADGTACGTGTSGARPPSCNGLIGSDYRCSAGACVLGANVDCSTFVCSSGSPMCSPDNPAGTAAGVPVVQCRCVAPAGSSSG